MTSLKAKAAYRISSISEMDQLRTDELRRDSRLPLTDREATSTRTELYGIRSKLASVKNQIKDFQRLEAELDSDVAHWRSVLTPDRVLPRDIMEEIFMQCLPQDTYPSMSIDEAPLTLTMICRSWREIALSTPRLWCKVHIVIPPPEEFKFLPEEYFGPTKSVRLWLQRSQQAPLSLSVVMSGSISRGLSEDISRDWSAIPFVTMSRDIEDLWDLILSQSGRWKRFSLEPTNVLTPELIDRIHTVDAPLLEMFRGRFPSASAVAADQMILKAKTLRILDVRCDIPMFAMLQGFLRLPIQWDKITSLSILPDADMGDRDFSILPIHPSYARDILQLCVGMTNYSVVLDTAAGVQNEGRLRESASRITHNSLESLSVFVTSGDEECLKIFFDETDLPELKSLSVSEFRFRQELLRASLFSARCKLPKLTRLSVYISSYIEVQRFKAFMEHHDQIADLQITYHDTRNSELLSSLISSDDHRLLPNLKYLEYRFCSSEAIPTLIGVLESRINFLSYASIYFNGCLKKSIARAWDDFQSQIQTRKPSLSITFNSDFCYTRNYFTGIPSSRERILHSNQEMLQPGEYPYW
jgi:hypothetical protein